MRTVWCIVISSPRTSWWHEQECAKTPSCSTLGSAASLPAPPGKQRADSPPQDGNIIISGQDIVGYVCTTRHSDTLGWQYGLALIREGHAGRGETIRIFQDLGRGRRGVATATLVAPHFYDPEGARLRA